MPVPPAASGRECLREQRSAERDHPQAQDRQETEETSDYEEDPCRDANPPGRGPPEPAQKTRSGLGELFFEPIELTIESLMIPVGHSLPPLLR